jgi:hypothetical protein
MPRAFRCLPTVFNAVGAAVCLLLAACGGGGGGGAATGPSGVGAPAATTATLAFTSTSYFEGAPIHAVRATEQMMGFAQLVTDMTGRFVRKGAPLTVVVPCNGSGGTAALTLTDRDGDGVASKGDRLAVSMTGCGIGGLSSFINGELTFELNGATAVKAGTIEGDVQLGTIKWVGKTWAGAFHTLRSRTATAQSWRITTPGGASFSYTDSSQAAAPDTLRAVDVSKTVNYETAQSTLNLAMVLDAPGGTMNIATTTPITAYLQRPPEAGVIQFQGANGVVRLTTTHAGSGWDVRFILTYSGNEFLSQSYVWSTLTDGLMWWDGLRRVSRSDAIDRDTQEYAADTLRVELASPPPELMTASDAVYQVQFLRPPIDLPVLEYRFDDVSGYGQPGWNVAATAERHGAAILLRPAESLRGGRTYVVTATLNGGPWTVLSDPFGNSAQQVHDAEGHVLTPGIFGSILPPVAIVTDIVTSATSMASLAEKITLTGSAQPAIGANTTVASYHWSQVNGTPLRFSAPDAAVTTVSLGDVHPSAVETVQLQLTVTDSLGATEKTRTTITVGDSLVHPSRMWIRGLPYLNGMPLPLEAAIAFTPSYVPTRYADRFRDLYTMPNDIWDVQFGLPPGALFAAGSYAFSGAGVALATNAPDMILQNSHDAACTARSGSFTVLDAEYGADGAPLRLAIDFTISCNGGPQLFGNYRHNSSIPTVDTRTSN